MNIDKNKVKSDLKELLGDGVIDDLSWNANRKSLTFRYSRMYEAPSLSFSVLKKLSDHFGTDEIDVDGYGHGGCETCDYGSEYGHEIEIMEPTKNLY